MINTVFQVSGEVPNRYYKQVGTNDKVQLLNDFEQAPDSVSFSGERSVPSGEKTKAGLIAGSIAGVLAGINASFGAKMYKMKNPWICGITHAIASVGCGALVDCITNKKREEFATKHANQSPKEILITDDKANVSRTGEIYYKTNSGKKFGTLLGAVAFPLLTLLSSRLSKTGESKFGIGQILLGAASGFIMGAITDACSNKAASNSADKMSIERDMDI